jgi:hypothetical protein
MKISKNDFKIIFKIIINSTESEINNLISIINGSNNNILNNDINDLIKKYGKNYILKLINKINFELSDRYNTTTDEKIIDEINTTTDIDANYPFADKPKPRKQEIAKFFSQLKDDIKELKKAEVNIIETIESLNSEIEQLNESKNKLQTHAATFRKSYENNFKKFLAKLKI